MRETNVVAIAALTAAVALVGCGKGGTTGSAMPAPAAPAGAAGKAVAIDPVCQMEVEVAPTALQHVHEGKTYYFCAPQCVERFKAKPEEFLRR